MAGQTDSDGNRVRSGAQLTVALGAMLLLAGVPTTLAQTTSGHDDDLAVDVHLEPERPFTDEEIQMFTVVGNSLNSTVGDVQVSLRVDDTYVKNVSLGVLQPGEQEFVRHSFSPLSAGEHVIVAEASGTTPPNATNGTSVEGIGGQFVLVTERDRSDLRPVQPEVSAATQEHVFDPTREIVEGEFAQALWSVRNVGEGYSEVSQAELRLDGRVIDQATFPRLVPLDPADGGGVATADHGLQRAFFQADAGDHEIAVQADRDDVVDELDESNNVRTTTVSVLAKANPAVGAIEAERSNLTVVGQEGPPNPYAERHVTVTLTNEADGRTAQPVEVRAEICPEAGLLTLGTNDCRYLEEWEVDEYGAGETRTLETEWDPRGHAGDHEICVEFAYHRPQTVERDDRDCQDVSVIVGNTGLGGR